MIPLCPLVKMTPLACIYTPVSTELLPSLFHSTGCRFANLSSYEPTGLMSGNPAKTLTICTTRRETVAIHKGR
jgi:hypothetical protein